MKNTIITKNTNFRSWYLENKVLIKQLFAMFRDFTIENNLFVNKNNKEIWYYFVRFVFKHSSTY